MNLPRLISATRTHLVVGAVASCVAGWAWGPMGMAATAAGAALGLMNLWAIQKLAARALFAADSGDARAAGGLIAGLIAKMAALFVAAWIAVSVLGLAVLPFGLGFSTLIIALMLAGQRSLSQEKAG